MLSFGILPVFSSNKLKTKCGGIIGPLVVTVNRQRYKSMITTFYGHYCKKLILTTPWNQGRRGYVSQNTSNIGVIVRKVWRFDYFKKL